MIPIILSKDIEQSQRLFHGRGGQFAGLEHITIDWFSPIALITLYKDDPEFVVWAREALRNLLGDRITSIVVQHRWQKGGPMELVWGEKIESHYALEGDLRYQLKLFKDQNVGFFLDMEHGRQEVKALAAGKRVLNLFAYTCSFSVTAVAGGAQSVCNIDLSSHSLSIGRRNHLSNNLSVDNVSFYKFDILKSFGRLKREGPFDLIIIDPPSFQKGSFDVKKDYEKIVRRLNDFAAEKCLVFACLNSVDLDSQFLTDLFGEYFSHSACKKVLTAPSEFVESDDHRALKVCLFELS